MDNPPDDKGRRLGSIAAAWVLLSSVLITLVHSLSAISPTTSGFLTTDITIFTADGGQIIGRAQYTISFSDGTEQLHGESTYSNGERDVELEHLKMSSEGQPPTLVSYQHLFFNADYAGAAQVLFVTIRLRQGANDIDFHSFNCMPGPKIVATKAVANMEQVQWHMHPGGLIKVKIQADFGWADLLIAPFVRKAYAWSDPNDNWSFAGRIYDRYYGGLRILTVRNSRSSDKRP